MSRGTGYSYRQDVSLQEYFEACAGSSSGSSVHESDSASDQDSPNYWRAACRSPLRGKARLKLHQRNSVQHALQERRNSMRRGRDAETTAALLAKPLHVAPITLRRGDGESRTEFKENDICSTAIERIIFDVLCALRQSPNECFETSILKEKNKPPVWSRRKVVITQKLWENDVPFSVRTLVEKILTAANLVAQAHWQIKELATSLSRDDIGMSEDTFSNYGETCTGDDGLLLASSLVLSRFSAIVRLFLHNIASWALHIQEEVVSRGCTAIIQNDMLQTVEKVLLPIKRCILLMEDACSITHEQQQTNNSNSETNNLDTVTRATGLIDYLIVRMSVMQDSNTMDLYRFYMVLLIYCSWPYVLLMTSAIFGFVTDIDANTWRSKIPRIFRLSFSHIRVSENNHLDRKELALPTDILSLVLLCVGYEGVGPNEQSKESKRQRCENRSRRRAAFASMLSSRSFILRSFVAFSRQKTLVGWCRKRAVDQRPTGVIANSNKEELWRTTLSEWQSWRFLQQEEGRSNRFTDIVLPLVLSSHLEYSLNTSSQSKGVTWALQVDDNKTHHDMLLLDTSELKGLPITELWLHTSLPAARWVSVSLLVPIGQVVQRLHERRLVELLSTTVARQRMGYYTVDNNNNNNDNNNNNNNNNNDNHDNDSDDGMLDMELEVSVNGEDNVLAFSLRDVPHKLGGETSNNGSMNPLSRTAVDTPERLLRSHNVTFREAVKLIIDVVLCRDSERIVYTFLHRLFLEPHWWFRRDAAEYTSNGTASIFISNTFADALRGKPLGPFVRLAVAPKTESQSSQNANDGHPFEMLRTFASFELIFTFPWDIALILLPSDLCVEWGKGGNIQEKYASYFWKNRRRKLEQQEKEKDYPTKEFQLQPQDYWSYCFGYLCSLYYAQISLREQRKRLQRRDVDTYHLMSVLGTTEQGKAHAARITRGLGSAYFELSFAVDSLLGFTQNIVSITAREMEEELTRMNTSAGSCITLCQRLDSRLLRLLCVCFPVQTRSDAIKPLPESTSIRESITLLLTIALDPANLPLKHVTSRTQNAIEALVTVVRSLPMTSVLREHVWPLLVLLTFNRFYGE
ncbi:uncharacterized protein TM35_000401600 [Trypanosoma theileri]|uniref:Uncharacterized protein n=1 Tax=Trypanosoma theileri TaxID=67003 RepID=A0A1X0NKA9_9TRYP|nr:uncharacterized protein TM35_000401600 [Trypanosoma theileri]ORC84893.1 hypothetical protein TM35_000401600 [Trypanosoma theileri]